MWGMIALLSLGSSCSFSKQTPDTVNIEIQLPSLAAEPARIMTDSSSSTSSGSTGKMILPASIQEFSCIAINVYGAGVEQTQLLPSGPDAENDEVRVGAPAGCAYPGIQTQAVAFSGGATVQLAVPSGKARGIQVIGIQSATPCAGVHLRDVLEAMIRSDGDSGYLIAELGSTTADLFGDTTVKISNSFDPKKVKFPFHCLDDIYYRFNHKPNGPGVYVRQMIAGAAFTCALMSDARVQCWGKNMYGQLGRGFAGGYVAYPDYVAGPGGAGFLESVQEISAGGDHACARTGSGNIVCWGSNINGQLGVSNVSSSSTYPVFVTQPDKISNISNPSSSTGQLYGAVQLASGGSSNCAIRSNDTPVCWGAGTSGQLGNSSSADSYYPREVYNLGSAYRIFGGDGFFCAIEGATAGSQGIKCWGMGTQGQLGNSSFASSNIPTGVTSLSSSASVQTLALGTDSACAIANGVQYCWGNNASFQWGSSAAGSSSAVPQNLGTVSYSDLIGAGSHRCGLRYSSQSVECWGNNTSGQVGNGASGGNIASPTAVNQLAGTLFGPGAAGANHTCVSVGDTAWCWGMNTDGQLGPVSAGVGIVPSPVQVLLRKQ